MSFAMTVDVEEWFTEVGPPEEVDRFPSRLELGLGRLLEIFEETGTRATFFFLGYLVERHPDLVRRVAAEGHEIGCHGWLHRPLWDHTAETLRRDLQRCIAAQERVLGAAPASHRAPRFSLDSGTAWAWDVLAEVGFRIDSSLFPIRNPRYGLTGGPRLPFRAGASGRVIVVPISTLSVGRIRLPFCGGFYLRALPLPILDHCFRAAKRRGEPAVCYIHPWELDPDQPSLPTSRSATLRHRVGLSGTGGKLHALLSRHSFGTLSDLVSSWEAPCTAPAAAAPAKATSIR